MFLVKRKRPSIRWLSLKDQRNREKALQEARGLMEWVEAYLMGDKSVYPQIQKGAHYLSVEYNMVFSFDPWILYEQLKDFIKKLETGQPIVQGTGYEETALRRTVTEIPEHIKAIEYDPSRAPSKEEILGASYSSDSLSYTALRGQPTERSSTLLIVLLVALAGIGGLLAYFLLRRK